MNLMCCCLPHTGQVVVIQLLDWIMRGIAQVMFVNNPISGLLITAALFLQNPWWALNGLLGTLVSTASAFLLGLNRSGGISMNASSSPSDILWGSLSSVFMSRFSPSGTSYQRVYMATMEPWWEFWWLFSQPKEAGTGGCSCQMCSWPCCGKWRHVVCDL